MSLRPLHRRLFVFVMLVGMLGRPAPFAAAQAPSPSRPKASATPTAAKPAEGAKNGEEEAEEAEVAVANDSPRAALAEYLRLARHGHYEEAARYLDLNEEQRANGAQLARHLLLVLDRYLPLDLEDVSPRSEGDTKDGLHPNLEQLGKIKRVHAAAEPVRMIKRAANGGQWQFSHWTVGRIDTWYEQLDDHWLLDRMPPSLLRPFAYDLALFQWLALPVLFVVAFAAAFLLSGLTRRVLRPFERGSAKGWFGAALASVRGPLVLAYALAIGYGLAGILGLPEAAAKFGQRFVRGGYLALLFWTLSRGIGMLERVGTQHAWVQGRRALVTLIPLGSRVGKVAVFILAIIALFSELGYPVASVLAGLGIGGLAVALAGQKTLENLFGAFAIGTDQPFREGDAIKAGDISGTVERVGLRSTRLRTDNRTLISVPNGKLAEMTIESFAERDRTVLACKLRLGYDTTPSQLRTVLGGVDRALRARAELVANSASVHLTELAESCLVIEVAAQFNTADWNAFMAIREELFLQFMQIVADAGTRFALPGRSVYLASAIETPTDGKPARPR